MFLEMGFSTYLVNLSTCNVRMEIGCIVARRLRTGIDSPFQSRRNSMRRFYLPVVLVAAVAILASMGLAQQAPTNGPYKILKTAKVGGDGGFDYVYADVQGRRLYVPRSGPTGRITVFNLDTFERAGEVPNMNGHGAVVDPKTDHGFITSNPVVMFDSKTLAVIKTITVAGNPDGILFDAFNERVYDLSHSAPNATVIDAKDGSIVGNDRSGWRAGTGGQRQQGPLYVDIEDKGNIAVVDAKTMAVTAHYDVSGKAGTCAGTGHRCKKSHPVCRLPSSLTSW